MNVRVKAIIAQDWNSYLSLLLDETCGVVLSSQEEVALLEIMTCAVKRLSGAIGRLRSKVVFFLLKRGELATLLVTLPASLFLRHCPPRRGAPCSRTANSSPLH